MNDKIAQSNQVIDDVGEIITFYSFKGGTGRTMALSNIAVLTARTQKKVLLIDWDLEAPGLHRYFQDYIQGFATEFNDQLGLIDFFLEIDKLIDTKKNEELTEAELLKLIEAVDLNKYLFKIDLENIYILKAGAFTSTYPQKINEFHWEIFYKKVPLFFKCFATYLKQYFHFIYIDSRTGFTDSSGICTMLMPEKLCLIFTPNNQSLDGVKNLAIEALTYRKNSYDLRSLRIYPIPSRVEMGEVKLRARWRSGGKFKEKSNTAILQGYQPAFEAIFKEFYGFEECDLTDYFDTIQIQHAPVYAYGENLAVLNEEYSDRLSLTAAYTAIFDKLILEKIDNIKNEDLKYYLCSSYTEDDIADYNLTDKHLEELKSTKADLTDTTTKLEESQAKIKEVETKNKKNKEVLFFAIIFLSITVITLSAYYLYKHFARVDALKKQTEAIKKDIQDLTNQYYSTKDLTTQKLYANQIAGEINPTNDKDIADAIAKFKNKSDTLNQISKSLSTASDSVSLIVAAYSGNTFTDNKVKIIATNFDDSLNKLQNKKIAATNNRVQQLAIQKQTQIFTQNFVKALPPSMTEIKSAIRYSDTIHSTLLKQAAASSDDPVQINKNVPAKDYGVVWFKTGYFLQFDDMRVLLQYIDKQLGIQVQICNTTDDSKCDDKDLIKTKEWINYDKPLTVTVGVNTYKITLQTIDHAGSNPFKLAAYINVVKLPK